MRRSVIVFAVAALVSGLLPAAAEPASEQDQRGGQALKNGNQVESHCAPGVAEMRADLTKVPQPCSTCCPTRASVTVRLPVVVAESVAEASMAPPDTA